jgi:hypothetical protein
MFLEKALRQPIHLFDFSRNSGQESNMRARPVKDARQKTVKCTIKVIIKGCEPSLPQIYLE